MFIVTDFGEEQVEETHDCSGSGKDATLHCKKVRFPKRTRGRGKLGLGNCLRDASFSKEACLFLRTSVTAGLRARVEWIRAFESEQIPQVSTTVTNLGSSGRLFCSKTPAVWAVTCHWSLQSLSCVCLVEMVARNITGYQVA